MSNRINYKGFIIYRIYSVSNSEGSFYMNEDSLKEAKVCVDKRFEELHGNSREKRKVKK